MTLGDVYNWMRSFIYKEERLVTSDLDGFKSAITKDIKHFDGLVKEAGYDLSDIELGIMLIPSMSLDFDFKRDLTSIEKNNLLRKLEDEDIVVRWVIKMLLAVVESPIIHRTDGYRLSGVSMDMDIIPDVSIHLSD